MTNDEGHHDAATDAVALTPVAILNSARKAVPAIDYAIGAAGIAAAGSIVVAFLGNGRAAIIIMSGLFIAMLLLFVFARLVTAQNAAAQSAGTSLLWMVVAFFATFLAFTVTAVAFHWPPAWAQILGIAMDDSFDKQAVEKQLEVPKEISSKLVALTSRGTIKLIRLQLRSDDLVGRVNFAKREVILAGGGSYYSFARREHEFGDGADILFWSDEKFDEKFETGLQGDDYGFILYTGQGAPGELMTLKRDAPPTSLEPPIDAWRYLWDYKPPREIESISAEQRKSNDEFYVAGVLLSKRAAVKAGGIYLLRSIRIKRSDLLIVFCVVDMLPDRSVVIAWATLNTFEIPLATDQKG